jgi:hypothetical protein
MCQPGHLTRPLEPYVRELFEGCCERAARINRCPGGVDTVTCRVDRQYHDMRPAKWTVSQVC